MRLVDRIADWIVHSLTAKAQLRFGVILCFISVPLLVYGPFSGEQLLIYEMSAVALTLTGVTIVIGAEVVAQNEADDGNPDPAATDVDEIAQLHPRSE